MLIYHRPYDMEKDFQAAMDFIRKSYHYTQTYYNIMPDQFEHIHNDDTKQIELWVDQNDTIVGMITELGKNLFMIQIDPTKRDYEFIILKWMATNYDKIVRGDVHQLSILCLDNDELRKNSLSILGFKELRLDGWIRMRDPSIPVSEIKLPDGYLIRSASHEDYNAIALAVQEVFGHGEWFDSSILDWIADHEYFHEELDLVAVTTENELAAFCTFRIDPVSKITQLEPMGTRPKFRGKGLAKALINEGIRRTNKYDPELYYIGGAADNPAANRLYDATGFTEKIGEMIWVKEFE